MLSRLVHDLYTCWDAYCDYCNTCTNCLAMCRTATHICWCKETEETSNEASDVTYVADISSTETLSSSSIITTEVSNHVSKGSFTTDNLDVEQIETDSKDATLPTLQ